MPIVRNCLLRVRRRSWRLARPAIGCLLLLAACLLQPALAQQKSFDIRKFLPAGAELKQQFSLDMENDGVAETVLVYNIPGQPNDFHRTDIRVLQDRAPSGPKTAFEESASGMMPKEDLRVEKLRSLNGKEALTVIHSFSGAGTATSWYVLASVNDKIVRLDPAPQRAKALRVREYVDNGYNSVKSEGDLIIEEVSGYSRHTARCCPNRPSLEMSFRFTGDSIPLRSVRELPYGVPKSGPQGPLLRLHSQGLWAYGYQAGDGFLVLGGSESPKDHAPSTPAAVVALRKNLLEQGTLSDAGSYLVLMADYKFTSSSEAAGVMLGRPANGRIEWRDPNGKPADSIPGSTAR